MSISFHAEQVRNPLKNRRIVRQWIIDAIRSEKLNLGEINVVFCSDEQLLEMNNQFLQHDYYTDIITFDYGMETTISGDLFISIDRVKDNALKLSIPIQQELYRVVIHGVMHLCGYKDKKKSEVAEMRSLEEKHLKKINKMLN